MWRDLFASCQGRFVTTVPLRHVPSTGQNLASGLQLPGPVSRDYIVDSSICLRVTSLPPLPTTINVRRSGPCWEQRQYFTSGFENVTCWKTFSCCIHSCSLRRIRHSLWRYTSVSYWETFVWSLGGNILLITFYHSHIIILMNKNFQHIFCTVILNSISWHFCKNIVHCKCTSGMTTQVNRIRNKRKWYKLQGIYYI